MDTPTKALIAASINGVFAFLPGIIFIHDFVVLGEFGWGLGIVLLLLPVLLFAGGALIKTGSHKPGAILCIIGGVLTIPIGGLGIYAAIKGFNLSKGKVQGSGKKKTKVKRTASKGSQAQKGSKANPKVVDYVKKSLKNGTSLKAIKGNLLNAGWDSETVNDAISAVKKTSKRSSS